MKVTADIRDALDSLNRVAHISASELATDNGWCARKARLHLKKLQDDLAADVIGVTGQGRGRRYRITGRGMALLERHAMPNEFPKEGR